MTEAINGTLLLILLAILGGALAAWQSPEALSWLLIRLHVRRELIALNKLWQMNLTQEWTSKITIGERPENTDEQTSGVVANT